MMWEWRFHFRFRSGTATKQRLHPPAWLRNKRKHKSRPPNSKPRCKFGRYSALTAARLERLGHYQNGILKDADAVVEAKRFSYQHGQTTLLELLDAQRTANEVRSSYNDALADHAKALVELERAAQLWEIQF